MSSKADFDGLTGDKMSMQHSEQQSAIPTIERMNAMENIISKTTIAQDRKLENITSRMEIKQHRLQAIIYDLTGMAEELKKQPQKQQ